MSRTPGVRPRGARSGGTVTKISLKQTGDFSGETRDLAAVDTANLDRSTAASLEEMVRVLGFFDLPTVVGEEVGADLPRHEITVAEGDRQHTVAFVTFDPSPEVEPLRRLADAVRQAQP